MNSDFKLTLYKFAATHIKNNKDLQHCRDSLFNIQELYAKSNTIDITFCPIIFFASNIETIMNIDGINISYKRNSKIPHSISIKDLLILVPGGHMNNMHISQLYIRFYEKFNKCESINWSSYYSQYCEQIHLKYNNLELRNDQLAALFYVEYGFWNNLKFN